MLFMGEEWAAEEPFLFFCDFEEDLAPLVTEGRREEFESFPEFSDPETRESIPDPSAGETFEKSVLDWDDAKERRSWMGFYKELLRLRQEEIIPRLKAMPGGHSSCQVVGEQGLQAQWILGDGSRLTLLANLGEESNEFEKENDRLLYATEGVSEGDQELPAWSVAWYLEESD
jgi:1,4-alpha-glucan branching enzyme